MIRIVCILFLFLVSSPAIAKRLAVLPFTSNKIKQNDLLDILEEKVRNTATRSLRSEGITVIDSANMIAMLKDQGKDASCIAGECEIEIGRNISVDYIITGKLKVVDGEWILFLSLYDVATKDRLEGIDIEKDSSKELRKSINTPTLRLLSILLPKSKSERTYVAPPAPKKKAKKKAAKPKKARRKAKIHVNKTTFEVIGGGAQYQNGDLRFQMSGLNTQFPLFRLEGLQYTHGVGGSFLRPGIGFVFSVDSFWMSPHYVFDWLNTSGEYRHVMGLGLGFGGNDDVGISLKLSADIPNNGSGLFTDQTRYNGQLSISGFGDTGEFLESIGYAVEETFEDTEIGNTAIEVIGAGVQFENGNPRFQISALNFQMPLFRLEGLQYTHGVGGSFARPGVGFVLGGEYLWFSPHYVFDWLNTSGEYRHVLGFNLGLIGDDGGGASLKLSLDNSIDSNSLLNEQTRINAQAHFSGTVETDDFVDGLGEMVGSLFDDMHIGNTAIEVFGLGMQFENGNPRFQMSALNFQMPLFRLEGLQYTYDVGGSFLRPGVGFVLGSEYVWVSPHYVYDWLNTAGEKRHIVGMNLAIGEEGEPAFSVKVSADNPTNATGFFTDQTRINAQLQFAGLVPTDTFLEGLVGGLFEDPHLDRTAIELLGMGAQFENGKTRFQISALNFQMPLFRLEGLQYTYDVGGSFLRPGVGFVFGGDYLWVSPHYVFDWLNTAGEQRHVVGMNLGITDYDVPGLSLKVSADNPTNASGFISDQTRINAQIQFAGILDTDEFMEGIFSDLWDETSWAFSLFEVGLHYNQNEGMLAQIAGPYLQTPFLLRFDSVTYTQELGVSFIRPGLGIAFGDEEGIGAYYAYDWLNTREVTNHVAGIDLYLSPLVVKAIMEIPASGHSSNAAPTFGLQLGLGTVIGGY